MRIEYVQSILEEQELRLTERTYEREVEQAMKVSYGKKSKKKSLSEANKRHDGGFQK